VTVVVLAILALTLTWPAPATTEASCPLAGKRPADDLLTKGGPPSLCKADLTGINVSGAKLGGADLHEANLRGANLSRTDVRRANLNNVNLIGANLSSASGLTCDQIRGAQTDETTNLPASLKCTK